MSQLQSQAAEVFDLTSDNFQAQVLQDPSPILLDFWAPWCMPCQIMKPLFAEAAIHLKGEVRAAKVNVDDEPGIAESFGVQGIPTLVLMRGGKVLDAWSGVMPVGVLSERVRARLAR